MSTLITWAEAENQKMSFSNHTLEITYFNRRKPEPMVQRDGMSNFESHRCSCKNVTHLSEWGSNHRRKYQSSMGPLRVARSICIYLTTNSVFKA